MTSTVRGRFGLRLALWLACYGGIMLAWGERNAWPLEIVTPMLSLPVAMVIGRNIYRQHQISLETREVESQWTLLICFLLLAVGLASGLMLMMAVGWVCLGVSWLRPVQPRVPWDEWFKLPLLFLLTMPVVSDLAGSRHELLSHSGAELDGLEAVQDFLFVQLSLRIALFTVVVRFSGPVFWGGLAVLPFAFVLGQKFCRAMIVSPYKWVLLAGTVFVFVALWRVIRRAPPIRRDAWRDFTIQLLSRPQSPWLAGLVITLQQSALLERWRAGGQPKMELIGVFVLLILLLRLRWHSRPAPLHVFSQILLAGALFVLLAAEWTDLNVLRQISLGMLVISAFSWQRSWSLWILIISMACWSASLPAAAALLTIAGFPSDVADQVRVFLMAIGLATLLISSYLRPATSSRKQYSDFGWMPVKRFALILLLLLAAFQIVSVYLPGAAPPVTESRSSGFTPVVTSERELLFFRAAAAEKRLVPVANRGVDLFIATPLSEPVQLQSPELVLQNSGWTITGRRLLPHARGQVIELQLERDNRRSMALCWYQFGNVTFTHYLRARNIVWSGWNLNHRDLRLVVLLAGGKGGIPDLVEIAEANDWFFKTGLATRAPRVARGL